MPTNIDRPSKTIYVFVNIYYPNNTDISCFHAAFIELNFLRKIGKSMSEKSINLSGYNWGIESDLGIN